MGIDIQEDGDLSPDIDEKSLAYPLLLLKTLIIFSFCIFLSNPKFPLLCSLYGPGKRSCFSQHFLLNAVLTSSGSIHYVGSPQNSPTIPLLLANTFSGPLDH